MLKNFQNVEKFSKSWKIFQKVEEKKLKKKMIFSKKIQKFSKFSKCRKIVNNSGQ